jgi:hypothetical protein
VRIVQAGKFIKDRAEGEDDWEHYWRSPIHSWLIRRVFTGVVAACNIFLGAQLLILIFAYLRFGFAAEVITLLVIDILAVMLTGGILYYSEDRES